MSLIGLDERLCAAIERLGQARRAHLQMLGTRHGVSPLQLEVLRVLAERSGPGIAAVAKELDVAVPTVTDAVGALQRKGLVLVGIDPADRRRRQVHLTADGQSLGRDITVERTVMREGLAAATVADKAAALSVLLDVIGTLHRRGVISVDRSCRTCRFHRQQGGPAGYCTLLDIPLTRVELRVDCPEHQPLRPPA